MSTTKTTTGWREALTPHSRASRQRWTAFYALLLVAVGVGTLDRTTGDALTGDGRGSLIFVLLLIVFGMLRRGTRRLTATDHPELDERDRRARDRAFRLAMPLFVLVVVVTVLALPAALDSVDRDSLVDGRRYTVYAPGRGWFISWWPLVGLVGWFALWAVFLPTGVLAWREPDAPTDDESPTPQTPELTRDVVLGGAVVTAVALTTVGLGLLGIVVLAGSIAGLGALARRAGARLTIRPQLVAAVVGAIVVLVGAAYAVGLGVDGGGSSTDDSIEAFRPDDRRLPPGVTRWMSQYRTTCLVVKAPTGAAIDRRAARARMERLDLGDEQLCRF